LQFETFVLMIAKALIDHLYHGWLSGIKADRLMFDGFDEER